MGSSVPGTIRVPCLVVFGRRLLVLLLILAGLGVPAGVLRATCAGKSCQDGGGGQARVPFCPLPAHLKADIEAGFRQGRSPDVLAVTRQAGLWSEADPAGALAIPWPSLAGGPSTSVPIAFWGTGIARDARLTPGTGLDQIAPTLSDVLGFRRPHPDVRAGTAVPGVADGERPRLVLEIAWKGVGSEELKAEPDAWPYLMSLMRVGAGTMDGDAGSLPLDPAATLTTIGTGGLPSQHGITGTLIRNDRGAVVRAWGPGAPPSVIATLPDDLDQAMNQKPLIGIVEGDTADQGIIGGTWYLGHDRDRVVLAPGSGALPAAERLLGAGFGLDSTPDILAVVLEGPVGSMDAWTKQLVAAAERASGGSLAVVVVGTGTNRPATPATGAALSGVLAQVEAAVPGDGRVVAATVAGGLFLDQQILARQGISGDAAVQALLKVTGPDGRSMIDDVFQGFAVSFARYC